MKYFADSLLNDHKYSRDMEFVEKMYDFQLHSIRKLDCHSDLKNAWTRK